MLKILLIEDEFIIAKDIAVLLNKDDYAVVDDARIMKKQRVYL